MKKKYSQEDIDQFFGNFKELPEYYDLEKVHQLINNPDAKATQTGNNYFKPYKFLIMTSTIIAVVASLLLWPDEPFQTKEKDITKTPPVSNIEKEDNQKKGNPIPPEAVEKVEESFLIKKEPKREVSSANLKAKAQAKEKTTQKGKVSPLLENPELNNDSLSARKRSSWPADTAIDGTQFLITLTDEELERLGFILDETGIYYHNKYGDQKTFYNSWRENNNTASMSSIGDEMSKENKKSNPSSFNFYPVSLTDAFYLEQKRNNHLRLMDDTLAPVILKSKQHRFDDDDRIIWFIITESFLSALPERYHHLRLPFGKVAELKRMYPAIDIVKYEEKSGLDNIRFIELTERELIPIGFELKEDGLLYKDAKINLEFISGGASVSFNSDEKGPGTSNIILSFLSNDYGRQMLKWRSTGEDTEKSKTSYFFDKTQILVPIVIRQSSYPQILQEDQVFWFEPSEALFAALPNEIGSQLKQEYNYLTAPNEEARRYLSTSCTFFEACKSTLQLNNLKLMPNPASYTTTISFEGLEATTGTISLVNLSGNMVKVLVSNETLRKGTNTFQLDLTDVGPGIYLISINTNEGFKTQRLVITR